jgi:hypothetical protein
MATPSLKNVDILHALQAMGVHLPSSVDTNGNQHGEFMKRLAGLGVNQDMFNQAEKLAGWDGNRESIGNIVGGPLQLDEGMVNNAFHNYTSLRDTGQLPPPPQPQPAPTTTLPAAATGDYSPGALKGTAPRLPVSGFAPAGSPGATPYIYRGDLHPAAAAPAPAAPAKQKPPPGAPKPAPAPLTNTAEGGAVVNALPKNASDAQVEQYLRQNYGSDTWVLQVPEIRKIVFDNLKNPSGVTQGIITSAIQATPWWQQNGQHVADFLQHSANDPIGTKARIATRQGKIESVAATYGLSLTPDRALALATDSEKWQWDDTAVNAALSGEFHYQTNQHTVFTDKLNGYAKDYVVPVSDNTIQQWGQKIIANPAEEGNYREFLKEQAKGMFPGMAARLDNNETVKDIAKPFAATAAQYLEMDENDVLNNLSDPKWMTALDQVDPKTGVHSTMPPADWVRKIKDDPQYRFDYTEQAKQNAAGMATTLLKNFGAIA